MAVEDDMWLGVRGVELVEAAVVGVEGCFVGEVLLDESDHASLLVTDVDGLFLDDFQDHGLVVLYLRERVVIGAGEGEQCILEQSQERARLFAEGVLDSVGLWGKMILGGGLHGWLVDSVCLMGIYL
jgi:hypothetical protein